MTEDFSYAPEEIRRQFDEIYQELEADENYRDEEWKHFTPSFLDTQSQTVDREEVYRLLQEKQKIIKAEKIAQPEASIEIPATLPLTIFAVGDIHSGSVFTNEQLWEAHRDFILRTPGAYIIFGHNLVDNAIPTQFANNLLNNTIPPHLQFSYMQAQIKELDEHGKVLAAIEGDCHEGWSWKVAGIPASNLLYGYEGRKFPVLENGSILNAKVGNQEYRIGIWHKQGPFNSNFNKSHSLLQNRRLGNRRTDVELAFHNHLSEALDTYVGYKENLQHVGTIRGGSYKGYWKDGEGMNDQFVIDRWGKSSEPPGNSFMLYPFDHGFETTLGFEAGARKHEAIRLALWLETVGQ